MARLVRRNLAELSALLFTLLPVVGLSAEQRTAERGAAVDKLFAGHCIECHGPDSQEGALRLDTLAAQFDRPDVAARWQRILERMHSGEMPPADQPRPDAGLVKKAGDWIDAGLLTASLARREKDGRAITRRLNRVEYEQTLHDLLAIDEPLKDRLPDDGQAFGFDKVGQALGVSSVFLERYLDAADAALDAAIVQRQDDPFLKVRYTYEGAQTSPGLQLSFGSGDDFTRVFFLDNQMPPTPSHIPRLAAPVAGRYRVRMRAYAYQSDKPLTFRVYTTRHGGPMGAGTGLVGYFSAPPALNGGQQPDMDSPPVEFEARLRLGETVMVMPYGTGRGIFSTTKTGPGSYKGIGLAVNWIEFEGPLPHAWPPESHTRLFGDLPLEKAPPEPVLKPMGRPMGRPQTLYRVTSPQPRADAERIVRAFVPRAFRRSITAAEAEPYVKLALDRLDAGAPFDQAVRAGMKGALCSPDFLLLNQGPAGSLTDEALASRLSYFLWSSCPDEALAQVAARNELHQPEVLRAQVERMLSSPKSARFVQDFAGQWLQLRDIDFTLPDLLLYPEFDEYLRLSMLAETEAFLGTLVRDDLSVRHIVTSEFALLNERLAKHYRLDSLSGPVLQKVALPEGSHRGGIITQAAVLKVTANGTSTSPVMRGRFLADRILGLDIPPPPAGVPAVEPDIRGTTTIREQLAKHREIGACAVCHRKLDPLGFALENFDVIGGWRDQYRVLSPKAPPVPRLPPPGVVFYQQGPKVDVGDRLTDGTAFNDFETFRELVLRDPDQLARGLAAKLIIYATGSPIGYADRRELEAIVAESKAKQHGVRALIHAVVQSPLFRMK